MAVRIGVVNWTIIGILAWLIAYLLTRRATARDYRINIIVGLVGAGREVLHPTWSRASRRLRQLF